jgi:hypothetical protein
MNKNIVILILSMLLLSQLNAKPHRTVKVYTPKPVYRHHNGKLYYVKVQPVRNNVIFVKPACPSAQHIWIDGDWIWNPQVNQYVWVEGKWVVPVQNAIWVSGHWKNTKYGWHWVNGHWR